MSDENSENYVLLYENIFYIYFVFNITPYKKCKLPTIITYT